MPDPTALPVDRPPERAGGAVWLMPNWIPALRALVVPPACLACRAPLLRAGAELCGACRRALPWLGETCPRCALPVPPAGGGPTLRAPCGSRCPAVHAAFEQAWAPFAHEGPARALVVALKHGGRLPVAHTMAAHVVAGAPVGLLAAGVVLVPVPADPRRRRVRGFDHADRLARAIAVRTGLPVVRSLRRAPGTAPQVGRGRRGRIDAAHGLRVTARSPPARAVLIDDVHTTGATLDACASALRAGGARWVAAVSYTRALG